MNANATAYRLLACALVASSLVGCPRADLESSQGSGLDADADGGETSAIEDSDRLDADASDVLPSPDADVLPSPDADVPPSPDVPREGPVVHGGIVPSGTHATATVRVRGSLSLASRVCNPAGSICLTGGLTP